MRAAFLGERRLRENLFFFVNHKLAFARRPSHDAAGFFFINMSNFETIFQAALAYFEKSEGQVFTWAAVDYTCAASAVTGEQDFETQGYRLREAVDIEASTAQFGGSYPKTGDPIQYGGTAYIVPPEIMRDAASIRFRAFKTSA